MRISVISVVAAVLILTACSSAPPVDTTPEPVPATSGAEEPEVEVAPVGDACGLLDEAFLEAALETVESPFGGPLDFQQPLQTSPSAYCSWSDPTIPAEISIQLEDAEIAELDDHSERAFNVDVDPVVEPQDGPGDKAVILVDTAFENAGGDELAYGYFFVENGLAVYLKVSFLDLGRDLLRVLADEVHARIQGA